MKSARLDFLDGIRGFMALNVVLAHFMLMFFPNAGFLQTAGYHGQWAFRLQNWFANVFVNSDAAIQYFFVLTGFLMAKSFLSGRQWQQQELLPKAINRYLRLLPMIAGATLVMFLIMTCGLQFHFRIADKLQAPDWVMLQAAFTPTAPSLIRAIFYDTFLETNIYVTPFWTIRYEFWGYLLCMLACYVMQGSKLRRLGYGAVIFLVWTRLDEYYVGFFLGALAADLCFCPEADATVLSKFYARILNHPLTAWLLLIPGLGCVYGELYTSVSSLNYITGKALGIAILLFCLMKLPVLARPFAWKPLRALGKVSFGIYAFHWPMMLTVESIFFGIFYDAMSYPAAAWLSLLATMPVLLAVSWGAWWLLEEKCRVDVRGLLKKL